MPTSLELKNVSDLSGMTFIVPAYQRGYRWERVQVTQLIEDILAFDKTSPQDSFYCLQPVVVRKLGEKKYELIDGQQRLTTMYLILKASYDAVKILYPSFGGFELEYKTRPGSATFLKRIVSASEEEIQANADYFFMFEAYQTAKEAFKGLGEPNRIIRPLLGNDKNVRLIWYEIDDQKTNPVDLFTRLNIGKIPLTNSELIKALILNSKNFSGEKTLETALLEQRQIASEWDAISRRMQDNAFWYFMSNAEGDKAYPERMDYLFDCFYNRPQEGDYFYTFDKAAQDLNDHENHGGMIYEFWKRFKDFFLILEEWYMDRELYHYIGFLLQARGRNEIPQLMKSYKEKIKSTFKDEINKRIRELMSGCRLAELNYSEDKERIRRCLLLFNILSLLDSTTSADRFPFDRYSTDQWDIEHISPKTPQVPAKFQDKKKWAQDILKCLDMEQGGISEEDAKALKHLAEAEEDMADRGDARFTELYERIRENYAGDIGDIDALSNLTLLDSTTNRAYKNALFPLKRLRIIENDKNGVFVPLATKNVFLKYYTPKVGRMLAWTKEDAAAYLDAMKAKLDSYLPQEENTDA